MFIPRDRNFMFPPLSDEDILTTSVGDTELYERFSGWKGDDCGEC
ncbi:hypothetical protein [Ruminococcus sp.]|nr:hypothetical protein [Ruminococcus sp.]